MARDRSHGASNGSAPLAVGELAALLESMLALRYLTITDLPASAREDTKSLRRFIAEAADLPARIGPLGDAITEVRRARAAERRLAARVDAGTAIFDTAERGKEYRTISSELRRLNRQVDRNGAYYLRLVQLVARQIELLDDAAQVIGVLPLSGFLKAELFFRQGDSRGLDRVSERLVAAADFDMLDQIAAAAHASILPQLVAGLRRVMNLARLRERFEEFSSIAAETSRWLNRWDLIGAVSWLEALPLVDWLDVLGRSGVVRVSQSGPGATWFVRGAAFENDAPVPTTREGRLESIRQQRLLKEFFS